ncbi:MAG: dihydrofolate synthase / folylpolyglutamate synthase, partial [Solirubrobacteraceae bacterium]|nr:dihydrofolate synthase / folylpolyglutamate synthase [Solirubrobacteraceae bacterium]
ATNVLDAPVVVLTSVGLEHTRWLGPTLTDIAREKLAVVPPGGTLVYGPLPAEALDEVRAIDAHRIGVSVPLGARLPGYQRVNAALAVTAVDALLGLDAPEGIVPDALDSALAVRVEESVLVPGRFQRVADAPLTIVDGAHNPAGMVALAEALPAAVGGRRLVACVSILDDKDAAGMLRPLLEHCDGAVFTASANPRALSPATLGSLAGQLGFTGTVAVEREPRAALRRAQALAGDDGAVIATGSIYLVADLLRTGAAAKRVSSL